MFAPFGLDDPFHLTVKANLTQITPETYAAKAKQVHECLVLRVDPDSDARETPDQRHLPLRCAPRLTRRSEPDAQARLERVRAVARGERFDLHVVGTHVAIASEERHVVRNLEAEPGHELVGEHGVVA